MNIIILTGRFGMGHVKCAEAIREGLQSQDGVKVYILDIIDWIFPKASKTIYGSFSLMVSKAPRIFNYLNLAADKHSVVPLKSAMARKIDKIMDEYRPDLIISSVPVSGKYISAYKDLRKNDVPLFTYITDITVHDEWMANNTDRYFVGSQSAKEELMWRGVPEEKISVTGVPVKKAFSADIKEDGENNKLLIMGGGFGMIPGMDVLLSTVSELKGVKTTLIAGKNAKLAAMVKETYPGIEVIGYTDKVNEFMRDADVVITKPGGITTFEAIASKTPIFALQPFLEQEKGNARFIEESGVGKVVYELSENTARDLKAFLENKAEISRMKENMAALTASFEEDNPLRYLKGASDGQEGKAHVEY